MEHSVVEKYEEDQLVVALPDLPTVKDALANLRVYCENEERDAGLGLALLTLSNVSGTPALHRDKALVTAAKQAKWGDNAEKAGKLTHLELLLYRLRTDFAKQYRGWAPTMGKNRVIAPVTGFPYVGGGGVSDPDPYVGGGGVGDPHGSAQCGKDDASPRNGASPPPWPTRAARPGHGVRIGLLDTRLYPNPWLAGGYLAAAGDLIEDPAPGQPPLLASEGHATFAAGLILHRAPGAQLDVRPVLDAKELGRVWDVAKTIADFVGSGVDILNLSFGCYTDDGRPPLVLARAVSRVSPEILLVAAAGNHGGVHNAANGLTPTTPMWPAAFDDVVAVTAGTVANGKRHLAPFSPKLPWVDVIAPGEHVESTFLTSPVRLSSSGNRHPTHRATATFAGGFACWAGTSFAAASVSGAVAAQVVPGRRNAREALNVVLGSSGDIQRYH